MYLGSNSVIQNIFIINQKAGNKKVRDFLNYYNQMPSELMRTCICAFPINANDTIMVAKQYSNMYPGSTIYSVGGDGTLNNVINGISSKVKLAVLPLGTGNDFYRVYKDIEGTKKIDIGLVNNRKFINMASVGLDAKMAEDANKYKQKKFLYNYAYSLSIIKEIIKNPSFTTTNGNISLLVVGNAKYYGNGVPINPNYNLTDGKLEIYYTNKLKRLQMLKLLLKVYSGVHSYDNCVNYLQSDKYSLHSEIPLTCSVDGEILYENDFHFSVLPGDVEITNDIPVYIKEYFKKNR